MRRLLLWLLPLLFVSGCSWFTGEEDNAEPPAELKPFERRVNLVSLWRRRIGTGNADEYLKLRPAVAGGRVFAADHSGRVAAFGARDGKRLWATQTGLSISGGVGVGEGLVVVGSNEADVVALAQEDGRILWRSRVTSEVLAPPAVAGGMVVVQSVDGNLAGLDAGTGERKWVFDRSVPVLSLRGTSTPVVAGDLVISGLASGKLVGLELKRGIPLWEMVVAVPRGRSELDRMVDIDSPPGIEGAFIYTVSYHGRVAAIDGSSGRMVWARDMSSAAGLGVDFAQVYVTDDQSHVWALNRRNGATMWKQEALAHRALTAPVPFGEYVLLGDFEGYLHALSRIDGDIVGRVRVNEESGILSPPLVVDDIVYVFDNGGTLTAYRVE